MSQEPYFVGDWESACAMLECEREDCRTPEGNLFQEVMPYRAKIDQLCNAWDVHVAKHVALDGIQGWRAT